MTTQADLVFDPALHRYSMGGRVLPSVTAILRVAGLVDATWFTDDARERGSYVHLASQYIAEGDGVDMASIEPELAGYVAAYSTYEAEHHPRWTHIEHPVASRVYGYAGTVDRVGVLCGVDAVLDIKTGGRVAATRLQLAAYAQAMREETGKLYRRYALYLSATGGYRLEDLDREPHLYQLDLNAFLSALTIVRWREREGEACHGSE